MESICVRPEEITPGVIITYKLRRDQRPVHPEKEWHGKVLLYNSLCHRAKVQSLVEGYEDCEDDVRLEQIVKIEKPHDTLSHLIG
ncbi:MAG TPA: hypothetical protein DDW25_08930 [Ktedonobacter sp.]|nr:hypothetical protein [Ktedonobacter sp.]